MNAIAESLLIDFKGTDVFQGSSIIIIATYTGDNTHKVIKNSDIYLKNTSNNPNVEIDVYEDNHRKKDVDVTNNKITVPYIVKVKNNTDKSDIKLEFTTNVANSKTKNIACKQHQYEDLDLSSLNPIVIGSSFIEDLTPVADGTIPNDVTNAHLNVAVYPRKKDNSVMKNCQIALHVNNINFTRLYDDNTEIFPFKDNMYYINTDDDGNFKIKIFPRKMTSSYVREINISAIIGDETAKSTQNALFITKNILPSDNIDAPIIENMNGDKIYPPSNISNSKFDVRLPRSDIIQPNDIVYIMSNVGSSSVATLCMSEIYGDRSRKDKPFKILYNIFPALETNTLYYYILTSGADAYRSKDLLFKLADSADYQPPRGKLERVTILDSMGDEIEEYTVFGIDSISEGVVCSVPVGGENQVKKGDTITLYLAITGYDPVTGIPVFENPQLDPIPITDKNIQAGNVQIKINNSLLSGVHTDLDGNPGPMYIYYISSEQEYSKSWQGFLDTAPLDAD
ncbi:hypothetical protein XBKQ1_1470005 [Xenorhabdus bovienii str. kraussei Quebec]|uniref:Uncharacterized protein n=1 Tax=Xenorhabdus bovienii str. kraussei Quebec TaxID=1398203 RepID=A0A077PDI0_XENBV|nr:hypothetical protein [Xenorhabdus bovienii]CDH18711.1 hypothetical protein XBKQ1_1470005 [Xenorhabdus bovienii str. kraussei Quebec]